MCKLELSIGAISCNVTKNRIEVQGEGVEDDIEQRMGSRSVLRCLFQWRKSCMEKIQLSLQKYAYSPKKSTPGYPKEKQTNKKTIKLQAET